MFKIDLIVWKSGSKNNKTPIFSMFKIDLIVWKYIESLISPWRYPTRFKIDLIVWKLFYIIRRHD